MGRAMGTFCTRDTNPHASRASGISTWGWVLGAAALGYAVTSRRQRYDFDGKVVLITGGSRGLGLATIASQSLVQLLVADATVPSQVEQAVSTVVQRFGRNNET